MYEIQKYYALQFIYKKVTSGLIDKPAGRVYIVTKMN